MNTYILRSCNQKLLDLISVRGAIECVVRKNQQELVGPLDAYKWVMMGNYHKTRKDEFERLTFRGFVDGWAKSTVHIYKLGDMTFYSNGGHWERKRKWFDVERLAVRF